MTHAERMIELSRERDAKLQKILKVCQDMVNCTSRKIRIQYVAVPKEGNILWAGGELYGCLAWAVKENQWIPIPKKWFKMVADPSTHGKGIDGWTEECKKTEARFKAKCKKEDAERRERETEREYEEFLALTEKYADEYQKHPELFNCEE